MHGKENFKIVAFVTAVLSAITVILFIKQYQ